MKSTDRLPALDGLRAISILIVALSHTLMLADVKFIPGGFGVTVFFFISGFIITRLLLQEAALTGEVNLSSFYVRRFFRLTPALLIYVAISVIAMAALGLSIPISDIAASLLYYANYHGIYRGFSVGGGQGVLSPLAITWSLAIEEHFYFLFPVLLVALRNRTDRLLAVLCSFVMVVGAWRAYLVLHAGPDLLPEFRIYMASDTRLDSIAFGCLLSVLFHRAAAEGDRRAKKFLDNSQSPFGLWLSAALLVLSFVLRGPVFRDTLRYSVQGLALMPIFCALFWTGTNPNGTAPRWLKSVLQNRVLVYVGAISYSLYLYHFLSLAIAQQAFRELPAIEQVILTWCLAMAGSLFSYYLIEGPARRFGTRFAARIQVGHAAAP